jgi:hypothetical protein
LAAAAERITLRRGRTTRFDSPEGPAFMKMLCSIIGIALLVIAGIYFVTPADTLPSFFLGHEAGVMRVHVKHGIVAAAAGVVFLALGWWFGRR